MRIGKSLNEISRMSGSSASGGSSDFTRLTRSRTRWMASSITTSGTNSSITMLAPSAEVELIFLRSFRLASSFSTGMVTSDSMSAGDTPMYGTVTITTGTFTSGAASRGNELYVLKPKTRMQSTPNRTVAR